MSDPIQDEFLYPLSQFRHREGVELGSFATVTEAAMPEPYRSLLVHDGDMTSRLEAFHGGAIHLEVLHREETGESYRREVVLRVAGSERPVEYGAIEIHLDQFGPTVRAAILAAREPLGGIMNEHQVVYRSEPQAFFRLASDGVMARLFGTADEQEFFGRCNVLRGGGGEILARIVEVLRPSSSL